MKRTAFLLIALMLLITCVPASAEVTVQDIQNAWAAANIESFHMNIQADLTVNVSMEGTTMQVPMAMDMNYIAKGDKGVVTAGVSMQGMQYMTMSYYFNGTQVTATINAMGQSQTITQAMPEPFNASTAIVFPEGTSLTPTDQGYEVTVTFAQLLSSLGDLSEELPMDVSGDADCVYLFGNDLMPVGGSATFKGLTMSMQGMEFTMDGTMTMNYTGFNDVTDDELVAPTASKAA